MMPTGSSAEFVGVAVAVLIAVGALAAALLMLLRWPSIVPDDQFTSSFLQQEARLRRHRYAQILPLTLATAAIAMLSAVALGHLPRLRQLDLTQIHSELNMLHDDIQRSHEKMNETLQELLGQAAASNETLNEIRRVLQSSRSVLSASMLPGAVSFPGGKACEGVSSAKLDEAIAQTVGAMEGAAVERAIVGVLVFGRYDVRDLTPPTRREYVDNSALAYRRASCVAARLRELLPVHLENIMMLPLIAGPQHVGPARKDAEMQADRQAYAMLIAPGA